MGSARLAREAVSVPALYQIRQESGRPWRGEEGDVQEKWPPERSWRPSEKCFWVVNLKGEFGGDLQRSRSAATQEWIADPDVARGGQLQPLALRIVQGATVRADAVRRCVRNECRQVRIGKIGMIQKVVRLKAKLELEALRNGSILEKGEIELPEMRSNE